MGVYSVKQLKILSQLDTHQLFKFELINNLAYVLIPDSILPQNCNKIKGVLTEISSTMFTIYSYKVKTLVCILLIQVGLTIYRFVLESILSKLALDHQANLYHILYKVGLH